MSAAQFDPTKIDWVTLTHEIPHPVTGNLVRKQINQKFKADGKGGWSLVDMTPAEFTKAKDIYKQMGKWKQEQENASQLKYFWAGAKQELLEPITKLLAILPKKVAAYRANKLKLDAKIAALPPKTQSKYVPTAQSINATWVAQGESNLKRADAIIARAPASARTALSGFGALPLVLPIIGAVGGIGAYLIYKYLDISNKQTDAAIAQQRSLNERIDGEYKAAMAIANNPATPAAERQAALQVVSAISANARQQQLALSTPASMTLFGMPAIVPILLIGGGVVFFFVWKKKSLLPQETLEWLTKK